MKKNLKINETKISKFDEYKLENEKLLKEVESLRKKHEEDIKLINKLKDDNVRMKNNAKKDSTTSSKPSSTDIVNKSINNRVKTGLKKGGQKNHTGHTLKSNNVKKLLENEVIKDEIEHVKKLVEKKNGKNPKYILDLIVKVLVEENINEDYDKINDVQYGDNLKAIVIFLTELMSYDNIVKFISVISNNKIKLSKGTIVNWVNKFSSSINSEIVKIENSLLDSYYVNADDSSIKINGGNYNQLCICNSQSVMLYGNKSKSRKAWANTILPQFTGIIEKDGTRVFNEYTNTKSQCLAHIMRYLKGANELSEKKHKVPMKIRSFLSGMNSYRNILIAQGIESFKDEELNRYYARYDELIKLWKDEIKDESDIIYKDEKNLLRRMESKDKEEILYFLNDFKVPFTNNNAERCQRSAKQREKIGRFRSESGADNYFKIRSFILTLKKRTLDVFTSIKKILVNEPVL